MLLQKPAFEPVYDDPYSFEAYLENRKKADRSSMSQEERFAYDNRTASLSTMRESGIPLPNLHLIEQAKTALGTPYVPGGTDTQGFDCSGGPTGMSASPCRARRASNPSWAAPSSPAP